MTFQRACRTLALPMAVLFFLVSGPLPAAQAAMISTDQVLQRDQAGPERARVMDFLARDDVRRQIQELGVDPDEAAARVKALSDAEIARIADRLDQEPAGQSAVGAIVGAAVLVFIVLLVTDILCLTRVFPFTRCVRG